MPPRSFRNRQFKNNSNIMATGTKEKTERNELIVFLRDVKKKKFAVIGRELRPKLSRHRVRYIYLREKTK